MEIAQDLSGLAKGTTEFRIMCGICGFLNLRGQSVDEVVDRCMMGLPWHRGLNDQGRLALTSAPLYQRPAVFQGHGRLEISDSSVDARQPLPNEDETVWVVFDGEIYNRLCPHAQI